MLNWATNLGGGTFTLASGFLGSWLLAVVVGLALAVVLLLIAGVRLEQEKARASQFDLSFAVLPPSQGEATDRSRGVAPWNEHLLVTNNGPGGQFRASLDGAVTGIDRELYGQGSTIAWEGSREHERHLARGESANLRLIHSYAPSPDTRYLRFWVPPSPHSGSDGRYLVGTELLVQADLVRFSLRLVDVERDLSVVRHLSIAISNTGRPVMLIDD